MPCCYLPISALATSTCMLCSTTRALRDKMPSSSPGAEDNNKHVHFHDTYAPSSLSLRLKLGPREKPTMILRISVYFEAGRLPKIKVRTRKAKEKDSSRGRRRERKREREGRKEE